jgi:hypothetical protein
LSLGVEATDFSAAILGDLGRTVSYKVLTKTTDPMTGSETDTYSSASNKTVVFFLEKNKWIWDKEGLLEAGDAYIMATPAAGIQRYDRFSIDGQEYYIENVTVRHVAGVEMAHYGICFKVG